MGNAEITGWETRQCNRCGMIQPCGTFKDTGYDDGLNGKSFCAKCLEHILLELENRLSKLKETHVAMA